MAARHRTPEAGQDDPIRHQRHQRRQGRERPDAFSRLTHALLATAFLGAWLTAALDGLRAWHIACGYAMAGALLLRVAWSLAWPRASLGRWWRVLVGAWRRLRQGQGRQAGPLRPPTWSIAGLALVACVILVLVPACFVTGWLLSRLVDEPAGPVDLHSWLGTALMVAVATHVALIAVLGVLRGRCMACDMLPGGWDRRVDSGEGRD